MSDQTPIRSNPVEVLTQKVVTLDQKVTYLNTGLYSRNRIDKGRNWLVGVSALILIVFIIALTILVTDGQNNSKAFRRSLADCSQPPGQLMPDGYVNPGICYQVSQDRTQEFLTQAIAELRRSIDCANLYASEPRNGKWSIPCKDVADRLDALKRGEDPFHTTTTTVPNGPS